MNTMLQTLYLQDVEFPRKKEQQTRKDVEVYVGKWSLFRQTKGDRSEVNKENAEKIAQSII